MKVKFLVLRVKLSSHPTERGMCPVYWWFRQQQSFHSTLSVYHSNLHIFPQTHYKWRCTHIHKSIILKYMGEKNFKWCGKWQTYSVVSSNSSLGYMYTQCYKWGTIKTQSAHTEQTEANLRAQKHKIKNRAVQININRVEWINLPVLNGQTSSPLKTTLTPRPCYNQPHRNSSEEVYCIFIQVSLWCHEFKIFWATTCYK